MAHTHEHGDGVERRREARTDLDACAAHAAVELVPDPAAHSAPPEPVPNSRVLDVSRRGLRLSCSNPPSRADRLWLRIHFDELGEPLELIGRTCWERIVRATGTSRAQAIGVVGIELLGGSAANLALYERAVATLRRVGNAALATPPGLR